MDYITNYLNNFSFPKESVIGFVFNPEFSGVLLFLKIMFIIFSAALVINIFFLVNLSSWSSWRYKNIWMEFLRYKTLEASEILKKWDEIGNLLNSLKESDYKMAVLEADDVLSQALKMDGYIGDTMEDQLKKVDPSDISDTTKVLEAHKIRDEIKANSEKKISFKEAKEAVEAFKKAFEDLQKY